jgi:hypothetical protein
MERRSCSIRQPAALASLVLLTAAAGCTVLQTAALLIKGTDAAPEFDGLEGKKVAVVCKMVNMVDLSNSSTARSLAEAICQRLKTKTKKIRLVDPQKVADLLDNKGLEDPIQIGKQLKAEKVLAVDIESFGVREGQTLFHGQAVVSIHVYDVASKEEEWHKEPPLHAEYPSVGPTPAQEVGEGEFRNRFIASLADQIGQIFYPHDRYGRKQDAPAPID